MINGEKWFSTGAAWSTILIVYAVTDPDSSDPYKRTSIFIVPTMAVINHAASLDLCRYLKVERFPVTKKEKEPATWEWVKAFMAVASPHLGALAAFMFLTGARISEALALTWADVDLQARRALIRQTKIGDDGTGEIVVKLRDLAKGAGLQCLPDNGADHFLLTAAAIKIIGFGARTRIP